MALVGEEKKEIKSEIEEANLSDCLKCLKKYFGHSDFRPMQWKVIASILNERRDNCFFTARAYGKSLTYQFPPVYTDSIGVVVSPLVSHVQDQIREMVSNGVRACYLGSVEGNHQRVKDVVGGQYNIVYMHPEYITRDPGKCLLNKIRDKISLIAIDEAHCISQRGHDFRPAYCKLHALRLLCPGIPIVALAANITPHVQEDIINGLDLTKAQILCTSFDRQNLYFSVEPKSVIWHGTYRSTQTWKDIGPHIFYTTTGSIVVYCIERSMTYCIASRIRSSGYGCGVYHAGVPFKERKKAVEDFNSGRIRVICLTEGYDFGISINRLDVRVVILYGPSISLESFYQNAGLAGRDGLPAKCVMFYDDEDWRTYAHMRRYSQWIDEEERQRLEGLEEKMKHYVSNKEVCRRRYVLSYFGEKCDELELREGCCDICNGRLILD